MENVDNDVISHLENLAKSDKETRLQIELLVNGANEMVCFLNHLQSSQKVPLLVLFATLTLCFCMLYETQKPTLPRIWSS